MAIFGIGAKYDKDFSEAFIEKDVACLGWPEDEAPCLYNVMRTIKVGDLVHLKEYSEEDGLTVKAVGVVLDAHLKDVGLAGPGINVKWLGQPNYEYGEVEGKHQPYAGPIYEEMNPRVQKLVAILFIKGVS